MQRPHGNDVQKPQIWFQSNDRMKMMSKNAKMCPKFEDGHKLIRIRRISRLLGGHTLCLKPTEDPAHRFKATPGCN